MRPQLSVYLHAKLKLAEWKNGSRDINLQNEQFHELSLNHSSPKLLLISRVRKYYSGEYEKGKTLLTLVAYWA